MIRYLALALIGSGLLNGCTDPSFGLNIGGTEENLTLTPSVSGKIGNVSVFVGG